MMWINTSTLEYPVFEARIRREFPEISFPTPFVAPPPYAPVIDVPPPEYDSFTQQLIEVAPEETESGWEKRYIVQPLPLDQIKARVEVAVQSRLDTFARTRGYDGILSACTYASSTHPKFRAEGQYCLSARDATWDKCYSVLAEIESGARPLPTYDEFLRELPVLSWPDEV